MPIQVKCPSCQKTLRVNDALMGKKVRCPGCQAAVPVGGGVTAAKPSSAARKPPVGVASTVKRPAPPPGNDDEDEAPRPAKKGNSALPIVAIVVGALLLLFIVGGATAGYFIYRTWAAAADTVKQASIPPSDASKQPAPPAVPPDPPKVPDNVGGDPPKPPDKPKPPDAPTPPDTPKPPDKPAGPTIVQPIAQSIPLDCVPIDVLNILFPPASGNQAVIVTRVPTTQLGMFTVRIDRYDLTAGRKIDATAAGETLESLQDVTPDGGFYFCNSGNSTFSAWRLPNAKPVLDKWTIPSSSISAPGGVQTTIIAAYLLDDRRFVTINGGAQVFVWSIADKKEVGRYLPTADVAKYPQGLANGGTTAISPDRKKLAVFNGTDGFFVLDTTTLRLVSQVRSPEDAKQPAANTTLAAVASAFSADGGQFAAMFQWQKFGGKPIPANLVRWDLQSKQITARFENPTKLPVGFLTKIAWWGPDYCWLYLLDNTGRSDLLSWDRSAALLKTAAKNGDHPCPTGGDGPYWFIIAGADGKAVLKGVDMPADALKQAGPDAGQLLMLTPDGVVKK